MEITVDSVLAQAKSCARQATKHQKNQFNNLPREQMAEKAEFLTKQKEIVIDDIKHLGDGMGKTQFWKKMK